MKNRLLMVSLALSLAPPLPALADQTLYKYTGADGKVVYSDKAPPAGVKFEKMQVDTSKTGMNPLAGSAAPANTPVAAPNSAAAELDARARERQAQRDQEAQNLATLQQNYDNAVAALEAGKDPQEGERAQNANGTSRLTEAYFDRIAALQDAVDNAKRALDTGRRQ
jgi:hypothetical protein